MKPCRYTKKLKAGAKTVVGLDHHLYIRWFYNYYSLLLAMNNAGINQTLPVTEIQLIYRGLEQIRDKIPAIRRLDLYFALNVQHFRGGEFRRALRRTHAILNKLHPKSNPAMYYATHFFHLVLILELNRFEHLHTT